MKNQFINPKTFNRMETIVKSKNSSKISKVTEKDQALTSKNNLFFEMIIDGLSKLEKNEWEHYLKQDLDFIPKNACTKKTYTRLNRLTLYINMIINQFQTPFYATFNQISKVGGKLKKGSKSVVIQYFNFDIKHNTTNIRISLSEYNQLSEVQKLNYTVRSFVKYFRVFNVSLIENLQDIDFNNLITEFDEQDEVFTDIQEAEKLIENLQENKGLILKFAKCADAFYSPLSDTVTMPNKDLFKDDIKYYSTLFHELIHWTGNPSRLNRFELGKRESKEKYAFEELIAEIGAMLIYFDFELTEEFTNSLVYLKGWVKHTNSDLKQVETLSEAFSQSKKAVNFIYN